MNAMPHTRSQTDRLVEALCRPDSYEDGPDRVRVKETHLSWVFLTGRRAYKLKKPLRYAYLDFSNADARRLNCEREVRLNRRFTRDVYEGVAAVRLTPAGRARIGPPTPDADDWLVVMRQLDELQTLESALDAGTATAGSLAGPMAVLLDGYACRPAPSCAAFGYVNGLWVQAAADADELCEPRFGLDPEQVQSVRRAVHRYLARHAGTPAGRVRAGRLVEGHGDLRPEHVYLGDPPRIVDCLEFERGLRLLDPADELACLALHCERLGAAWVREALFAHYTAATGDAPETGLIDLYTACHGLLWAKLAIRHLDRRDSDAAHWHARSAAYLSIAERAAAALS